MLLYWFNIFEIILDIILNENYCLRNFDYFKITIKFNLQNKKFTNIYKYV